LIEIDLSFHELHMAASIGAMRQIVSLKKGLQDAYGNKGQHGWNDHIEGACGEVAFAKAMNFYWDGSINRFSHGGDVDAYQVKTRSQHHWDLLVRPGDADHKAFVLVTGRDGKYRVHGWAYAHEAKQEKWLEAKGGRDPAYWMPQSELHDLASLPVEGVPF